MKLRSILILLPLLWMGLACGGGRKQEVNAPSRVNIVKGYDKYDSTYNIVDGISGEVLYCSGHNPIELDTVIQDNYIFIENIITEEYCDRIIVCNPDDSLLRRAFLMVWDIEHLDQSDRERLYNLKQDKLLHTEWLDMGNRKIGIRLFNDKVISLELHGEQYGNYYLEWELSESNTKLWMEVTYKGKAIFQKSISYKDFNDIDNPEQYILAEPRSVHTDNDILVISTDMTMFDTDCGYDAEILISPDGKMKLRYIDIDSFLAFSDMIEDIRNEYKGEGLCDLVCGMDFYNEAESSAQEYAALYALCLYNTYEDVWEGVGGNLYDMFTQYPEKFDEFHMTRGYLPEDQSQKILNTVMDLLTFECKARADVSSQPSFKHFVSMFPYFDKPEFEKRYDSINAY